VLSRRVANDYIQLNEIDRDTYDGFGGGWVLGIESLKSKEDRADAPSKEIHPTVHDYSPE
jgi:hypothetical protein